MLTDIEKDRLYVLSKDFMNDACTLDHRGVDAANNFTKARACFNAARRLREDAIILRKASGNAY